MGAKSSGCPNIWHLSCIYMYTETSTVQENAAITGTTPTNPKTVHGCSFRECWQAPHQLGTSGHKSLHNLNVRLNVLHSCIVAPGGMFYLKWSSVLSSCSSPTLSELSPTVEPAFLHSFFFPHIPPACTTLVSAPQHTTPKLLCWPPVGWTCSL